MHNPAYIFFKVRKSLIFVSDTLPMIKLKFTYSNLLVLFQTEWFRNYLYYYEKKSVTPEMRNNGKQFEEFKAQLMEIEAAQNRLKLEEQGKQTPK